MGWPGMYVMAGTGGNDASFLLRTEVRSLPGPSAAADEGTFGRLTAGSGAPSLLYGKGAGAGTTRLMRLGMIADPLIAIRLR